MRFRFFVCKNCEIIDNKKYCQRHLKRQIKKQLLLIFSFMLHESFSSTCASSFSMKCSCDLLNADSKTIYTFLSFMSNDWLKRISMLCLMYLKKLLIDMSSRRYNFFFKLFKYHCYRFAKVNRTIFHFDACSE